MNVENGGTDAEFVSAVNLHMKGIDPKRNGYFLPECGPRIISVDRENGIITVDGGLTPPSQKRQVKARAKAKRAKQARKRNRK